MNLTDWSQWKEVRRIRGKGDRTAVCAPYRHDFFRFAYGGDAYFIVLCQHCGRTPMESLDDALVERSAAETDEAAAKSRQRKLVTAGAEG